VSIKNRLFPEPVAPYYHYIAPARSGRRHVEHVIRDIQKLKGDSIASSGIGFPLGQSRSLW
jgi:hypothetical protein